MYSIQRHLTSDSEVGWRENGRLFVKWGLIETAERRESYASTDWRSVAFQTFMSQSKGLEWSCDSSCRVRIASSISVRDSSFASLQAAVSLPLQLCKSVVSSWTSWESAGVKVTVNRHHSGKRRCSCGIFYFSLKDCGGHVRHWCVADQWCTIIARDCWDRCEVRISVCRHTLFNKAESSRWIGAIDLLETEERQMQVTAAGW